MRTNQTVRELPDVIFADGGITQNTCNSAGNKKCKQRNRTKGKRKKHRINRKR